MPRKESAAWVVAIVAILAYIMGIIILTAVDPLMQTLFDSVIWSSTTTEGTQALNWQQRAWAAIGPMVLVAIIFQIWIDTRQPS